MLLRQWYSLDENLQVGTYALRNLERMDDDSFWKDALPKLCEYFDGVSNERHAYPCQVP